MSDPIAGFQMDYFDTPNVLHNGKDVKGGNKNIFMGKSSSEKPYKLQIRTNTRVRDLFNRLCDLDSRAFNDEFKYLVEERLKALGFDFSKAQQSPLTGGKIASVAEPKEHEGDQTQSLQKFRKRRTG
jgi:hypothetical protein